MDTTTMLGCNGVACKGSCQKKAWKADGYCDDGNVGLHYVQLLLFLPCIVFLAIVSCFYCDT